MRLEYPRIILQAYIKLSLARKTLYGWELGGKERKGKKKILPGDLEEETVLDSG